MVNLCVFAGSFDPVNLARYAALAAMLPGFSSAPIFPIESWRALMANPEVSNGRRRFLTATTAVVGAVGAGFAAVPFIKSRSEEHTSELQSLMRISYAVFCLKKKKTNNTQSLKYKEHSTIDTMIVKQMITAR